MAAQIRFVDQGPATTLAFRIVSVTGDTSYPSGGYALGTTETDMKRIITVEPIVSSGHIVEWDRSTQKLKFFRNPASANSNPLVETTAGTNVSTVAVELLVIGYAK